MTTRNRLTGDDRDAIAVAILNAYPETDRDDLRRIGARAIGCTLADLRDSEVDWIDLTIKGYLALSGRPPRRLPSPDA
jgi:hypothetical protein